MFCFKCFKQIEGEARVVQTNRRILFFCSSKCHDIWDSETWPRCPECLVPLVKDACPMCGEKHDENV